MNSIVDHIAVKYFNVNLSSPKVIATQYINFLVTYLGKEKSKKKAFSFPNACVSGSCYKIYSRLIPDGHMINTNCSSSHNRKALCCKMSVEFDTFIDTNKK